MRVLQSLTGNATHMDGRERLYTDRDGNAKVALAEGPLCNGVGASRGNVRWYERKAKAVTCKSCLRILAKVHAEALAMHAAYMMTPEGQAQEDALAARRAEKCGQCGSERSNPRHHSAEGHAFVEHAEMDAELDRAAELVELLNLPARDTGTHGDATPVTREDVVAMTGDPVGWVTSMLEPAPSVTGSTVVKVLGDGSTVVDVVEDEDDLSGMYVELSSGLTEYVEPGDRLQHKDSGERGTVTAVGPNALDLRMDDGSPRSAASWFWGRLSLPELVAELPEVGPIDRQAVLATRVDSLLDSGVTDAQRAAELEQEGPLSRQLRMLPVDRSAPRLYASTGEAVEVLGSAVHGNGLRTGIWAVRQGRPLALAFFVDEDHLRLQFSAYRPGERARLADAARVSTPLATPSQVAELASAIAEQAELFAAGGVPAEAAGAFRSRMVGNVQTLARWLGMSEPVELVSYASPYGGPDLVDEVRRAHV